MTTNRTKTRLAGELSRFVQQYARKSRASESNDRQYDRKLEKKMKRISAAENYQTRFPRTGKRQWSPAVRKSENGQFGTFDIAF